MALIKKIIHYLVSPAASTWPWLTGLFALWLFLYRGFLDGTYFPSMETTPQYFYTLYFTDCLSKGIFPLWDPYHNWGVADNIDPLWVGLYNPFYLLILLFRLAGASAQTSYAFFMLFYVLTSVLGFYLLCRQIMKNTSSALLAAAALLFSSLSIIPFLTIWPQLIFTPIIWLLYFFVIFYKTKIADTRRMAAVAITFCSMIIVSTYIPLFALTFFSCLLLGSLLCAPRQILSFLGTILSFIRQNALLCVFLLGSLLLACVPIVRWYLSSKDPGFLMDIARGGTADGQSGISLIGLNLNTIWGESSWMELFSDQDIGAQLYTQVSFTIFFLFSLALPFAVPALWRALFVATFLLLLFLSANVFPVHRWVYEHVFFVRFFRNYFYLATSLLASLIILALLPLKNALSSPPSQRLLRLVWIGLLVVLWIAFLNRLTNVPPASYLTAAILLPVLSLVLFDIFPFNSRAARCLLLSVIIVQPAVVFFPDFFQNFYSRQPQKDFVGQNNVFSYTRPTKDADPYRRAAHVTEKMARDDSGFSEQGYMGSAHAYELIKHIPYPLLQAYVQNKLILYDRATYLPPETTDWTGLARALAGENATALVSSPQGAGGHQPQNGRAEILLQNSSRLKVAEFQVNRIVLQTDLPADKFLVYNDTYHSGWKAYIDGKSTPLYRANLAFKGIWIPRGKHTVKLVYGAWWDPALNWSLTGLFVLFMLLTARNTVLIESNNEEDS